MTALAMEFKPAVRSSTWLKIGVQGPSGSGKTLGALVLADALAQNGRVAVIDTENGSASLYADRFAFDVLNLTAPYTSERYMEALSAAVRAGYKVVIIDSLSHQWAGDGGILARKETVDARGGNHFSNWAPFTKEHERFKAQLLATPAHIIATMRSKQEYAVEEGERGAKAKVKKLGLAPIQREGMEYELSVVFELQMDHRAAVSKDRTGLFDGRLVDLTDMSVGREIDAWLKAGAPVKPRETDEGAPLATDEQRKALAEFAKSGAFKPGSKKKFQTAAESADLTAEQAEQAIEWATQYLKDHAAKQAQRDDRAAEGTAVEGQRTEEAQVIARIASVDAPVTSERARLLSAIDDYMTEPTCAAIAKDWGSLGSYTMQELELMVGKLRAAFDQATSGSDL